MGLLNLFELFAIAAGGVLAALYVGVILLVLSVRLGRALGWIQLTPRARGMRAFLQNFL